MSTFVRVLLALLLHEISSTSGQSDRFYQAVSEESFSSFWRFLRVKSEEGVARTEAARPRRGRAIRVKIIVDEEM